MSESDSSEFEPNSGYRELLRNIIDSEASDDDVTEAFNTNTQGLNQSFESLADNDSDDNPQPSPSKRRKLDNEEVYKGKDIDVVINRRSHRQEKRFGLLVRKKHLEKNMYKRRQKDSIHGPIACNAAALPLFQYIPPKYVTPISG